MSEVKNDEYIEINFSKLLGVLIKNIKIFSLVFVVCSALTIAFVYLWKLVYKYTAYIQMPYYSSNPGLLVGLNSVDKEINFLKEIDVIPSSRRQIILNNVLSNMQNVNYRNSGLLRDVVINYSAFNNEVGQESKDKKVFSLSVDATLQDKSRVTSIFDDLIKSFSDSNLVSKQIGLWKDALQASILLNDRSIERYSALIKQNQNYLLDLTRQKGLKGMDGQTLLSSYSQRIDSYRKYLFTLEDSQKYLKYELNSLSSDISLLGDVIYSKSSKLSKAGVLLAGFVLSIFASLMMVFVKIVLCKSIAEYRRQKD